MDITRLTISKERIINSLETLLQQEKLIENNINKIREAIKVRKNLDEKNIKEYHLGEAILYESASEEDIIFAFAAEDYIKLKEVRKDIRSCLRIAFQLKMHIDPTHYQYEHKPGIITKNYSEYILELNINPRYKY